jgi:hypothetical protein
MESEAFSTSPVQQLIGEDKNNDGARCHARITLRRFVDVKSEFDLDRYFRFLSRGRVFPGLDSFQCRFC